MADYLRDGLERGPREKAKAEAAKRFSADLAKVADTPEGERLLTVIIRECGLGRARGEGESAWLYNFGLRLLGRLGEVSPERGRRILARIFGMGPEK